MATTAQLPSLSDFAGTMEASLRADLDPGGTGAIDLSDGSDLTKVVGATSIALVRATAAVAKLAKGRDPNSAEGDELDELAVSVYQTRRKLAATAAGFAYLKRAGGDATSIPDGWRIGVPSATGTQPTTLSFVGTLGVPASSGTQKVKVAVEATSPGVAGNVKAALLASSGTFVDPLPDTSWTLFLPTISDPGPSGEGGTDDIGGGDDDEDDATLQARLSSLPSDWRRKPGSEEAIYGAAVEVPGVRFVDVIDTNDGLIALFAGDVNSGTTDSMAQAISAAVRPYRTLGVPVEVRPYNVQVVTVSVVIYMQNQLNFYDVAQLVADARLAVYRYFNLTRQRSDEYVPSRIGDLVSEINDDVQYVDVLLPTDAVYRQADGTVATQTRLSRYVVNDASISVRIAPPRTS